MIDPKFLNIDGIIKATAPIEIKQQYFIEKAKEVYGDRYLYDKVEYKSAKTKVIIGCRIHGDFLAIPNNNLSNAGGCPECAGNIKLTRETFQSKIDQVYGKGVLDSSNFVYINYKTYGDMLCKVCAHTFTCSPQNLLSNKVGCPNCHALDIKDKVLYILRFKELPENIVKIGITNNINRRMLELRRESNLTPQLCYCSPSIPTHTARVIERLVLQLGTQFIPTNTFKGCKEFIEIDSIKPIVDFIQENYEEYFKPD